MDNLGLHWLKIAFFALMLLFAPTYLFAQTKADSLSINLSDSTLTANDTIDLKKNSDFETTIIYKASDSIRFDMRKRNVVMYNNASIDYGKISLKANHIEMDWKKNTVFAKGTYDSAAAKMAGTPIFKQDQESYDSKEIKYNFQTQRAIVKGVVTKQGEAFVLGERIKREANNDIFVKNAVYTTCNHPQPHFGIKANKIKMVGNKEIITGPFFLTVEGVPTPLGFAFGLIPIPKKKTSGIIMPQYGEQRDRGFFLRDGGFYWAASEYLDVTILGEIYSRGGWGLRTQTRYKKRYHYDGNFDIRYTNLPSGERGTPTYAVREDFWVNWSHSPVSRGTSRFSASVNVGTSNFNSRNSANVNNYLSSSFTSSVNYGKTFKAQNANTSLSLQHQQNVKTGVMTLSPRWAAGQNSRYLPFKNVGSARNPLRQMGISYSYDSRMDITNILAPPNAQFKQPSDVKQRTIDTIGFNLTNFSRMLDFAKVGARHSFKTSTSMTVAKYFNVSPYASYDEIWYKEKLNYEWVAKDTIRQQMQAGFTRLYYFEAGTSVSTRFYSFYYFKSKKLKAIRHLMTPNVNFSIRPDFSDPSWGFYQDVRVDDAGNTRRLPTVTGNYGNAPFGKSGTVSFGLDNTIEAKILKNEDDDKPTNMKILDNFNVGGSYNFAADSFKMSNFNMQARTTLLQNYNINLGMGLDPYTYVLTNKDTVTKSVVQRRMNEYAWNTGNGIGNISNINFAFSASFDPNTFKKKENRAGGSSNGRGSSSGKTAATTNTTEKKPDPNEDETAEYINENRKYYTDFKIPWRFSLSANVSYSKQGFQKPTLTKTINFNGEFNITEKWKFTYRSGYDLNTNEISFTSIDITRDLHCWALSVNWVPFGPRQSYMLNLNVKAAVLQDLKLTKQNNWYDRR